MSRCVEDRPLSEAEREVIQPVVDRLAYHEEEAQRAREELGRLCLLARDDAGQILNRDTLVWEREVTEDDGGES